MTPLQKNTNCPFNLPCASSWWSLSAKLIPQLSTACWVVGQWGLHWMHQLCPPNLDQTRPHFSSSFGAAWIWSGHVCWYDVFGLQMVINWGTSAVLLILTSLDISWPSHLPTQLLLTHYRPLYVRGRLSVTLRKIIYVAWAIEPACTCSADHLLLLTLCITLPSLEAFLTTNRLFLPHPFCLLSLYRPDLWSGVTIHVSHFLFQARYHAKYSNENNTNANMLYCHKLS